MVVCQGVTQSVAGLIMGKTTQRTACPRDGKNHTRRGGSISLYGGGTGGYMSGTSEKD